MTSYQDEDGEWHNCTFEEELQRAVLWMLEQFLIEQAATRAEAATRLNEPWLAEKFAEIVGTTAERLNTDAPWPEPAERRLLVILVLLVERCFFRDDGMLTHSFMSAEEQALSVLLDAGLMLPYERQVDGQPRKMLFGGHWSEAGDTFRALIWERARYRDFIEYFSSK